MRRILIIGMLLFVLPMSAFADSCTTEQYERLKKIASNINYTIEESANYMPPAFDVIITGVSKELNITNTIFGITKYDDSYFGEIYLRGLNTGQTYTFEIYGSNYCKSKSFGKIVVSLPNYNSYYNQPICDKAREHRYCQKWAMVDVSYDEFYDEVTKYINNNQKKNNDNNSTVVTTDHDFYYFYNRYYWPVLITMIISLATLIYLWIKQNNKNKL